MTPALQIELGYHGVHLPIAATYHRQTCPNCSPWRSNMPRVNVKGKIWIPQDETCMVVRIISDTEADVICHHCGNSERIAA